MFSFKSWIFPNLYTSYDKRTDPNKDSNGKGTHERFCETVGLEWDRYLLPYIKGLQPSLYHPKNVLDKYVASLEKQLGYDPDWQWFYDQSLMVRRRLLDIMPRLLQIRGTIFCHRLMFGWKGWDMVLTETFIEGGFDSPDTFDSDVRTFDSSCPSCSNYHIALTGTQETANPAIPLSDDSLLLIATIIVFNQPINAVLTEVTFNGTDITSQIPFVDNVNKL